MSATTITTELTGAVEALARTPTLLVACDYDGTIAPLVDDPMKAVPLRETSVALRGLADLPQTHVAVVSGRSLRDLAALSRLPAEIHLVGSHGSEFDVDFSLDPELSRRRESLVAALRDLASRHQGVRLEEKPASVAVHYRQVRPGEVDGLLGEVESVASQVDDLTLRHAKQVCELLLVSTDKGDALTTLRGRLGASAVVFLGDDVTDEDAFATLHGPDVGVKVGEGHTGAHHRVDGPDTVAALLASLCERRADWLAGAGVVPIEHHSMLSDQRTTALVTPAGRVTWMCVPRIDSSAIFAELLGGPAAGHFSIRPAASNGAAVQSYIDDSLVLRTAWADLTVTDFLDCSDRRPSRVAGRTDLIRMLEGRGKAIIEFSPRLDFGRFPTQLEARDGGIEVVNAADLVVLRSPGVDWAIEDSGVHQTARAEVDLDGGPVVLELRCGTASLRADRTSELDRRRETVRYWRDWANRLHLPAVETDLVRRAALTIKALCYGPTGAIVAAATTSLPECMGGVRNWDYRYCWIRDAALSAGALVQLGSIDEAMDFLDWLLGVIDGNDIAPERLAPLYGIDGQPLPPEATIEDLAGYAGSRPVRVGNAADHQVQLDVFGPVLELIHQLGECQAPLSARHWRLVEDLVAAVEHRWTEPDQGIWEIRAAPRHHLHSKVMCWVTVDRAIAVADAVFGRQRPEWATLRDAIAADVLDKGWSDEAGAYTAAYGGSDLDAAALSIGLTGLVPPDDPRFRATVEAVEARLRDGPTVYRYRHDDGLPGEEGGFNLMTSWLIDAKILLGDLHAAAALLRSLAALAGPTGLLAEQYDPINGRALGNHPQAYSHLGLIHNAWRLSNA